MKKPLLFLLFFFTTLQIFGQAVANQPPDMVDCGSQTFNLISQNQAILGTQDASQYAVGYFESNEDAVTNVNPIPSPWTFSVVNSTTVFARVTNNSNGDYATTFGRVSDEDFT